MKKLSYERTTRIVEIMRQELAAVIQKDLHDPRLEIVSITEIKLAKDLSYARVYVLVLGDHVQNVKALNHAAGFLRTKLAEKMSLRIVPQLKFYYDVERDRSQRVVNLIDELATKKR